ncbi:hypothetical protein ACJX0J_020539, partial [Zea mays]
RRNLDQLLINMKTCLSTAKSLCLLQGSQSVLECGQFDVMGLVSINGILKYIRLAQEIYGIRLIHKKYDYLFVNVICLSLGSRMKQYHAQVKNLTTRLEAHHQIWGDLEGGWAGWSEGIGGSLIEINYFLYFKKTEMPQFDWTGETAPHQVIPIYCQNDTCPNCSGLILPKELYDLDTCIYIFSILKSEYK